MEIVDFVKFKKEEIKKEVSFFDEVSFLIIQVGDNEASNAYVKGKIKDALEVGIKPVLKKLDENIKEEDILSIIDEANKDESICGIIVQLPLPSHIDEKKIALSISYKKDIDGFHPLSLFTPCTPKGIIMYLDSLNYDYESKNALIIGRSNIVGKPIASLLLNKNCNVTITHSHTRRDDLFLYVKNADLIIVAVGKTYFLDDTFLFKDDAYIIDVGINRENGKLKGDVLPNLKVKYQSPVPKGVGLLTRVALLENILEGKRNGI